MRSWTPAGGWQTRRAPEATARVAVAIEPVRPLEPEAEAEALGHPDHALDILQRLMALQHIGLGGNTTVASEKAATQDGICRRYRSWLNATSRC